MYFGKMVSSRAFCRMREAQALEFPLTVYYAFKQAESDDGNNEDIIGSSNGPHGIDRLRETMLGGFVRSGFSIPWNLADANRICYANG